MRVFLKTHKYLFLLLLYSLPAVIGLLQQGFFVTDDGDWMIIRFAAFYEAFKSGQIPTRFLGQLNNGYGYPIANFAYPGFLYLGIPLHVLGVGVVDTIKIILGVSLIGSGFFTFLWLRKFASLFASLVGALVYVYLPYHLYDVYTRGSVGEVLALAVVPFILWQLKRRSLLYAAGGIALLLLSHNILAALFFPILLLYQFLVAPKSFQVFVPFLGGFGLATFFWLPALYDLQYTIFLQTNVSNWQEYFAPLSLVGIVSFFLLVVAGGKLFFSRKKRDVLPLFFFLLSVFSQGMALPISKPLWEVLPTAFVQFPFRFLSLSILGVAFLATYSVQEKKRHVSFLLGGSILVVLILSSFSYLLPQQYVHFEEGYYTTNQATTTVKNEYMPKWVKQDALQMIPEKVQIVSGEGTVTLHQFTSKTVVFTAAMKQEGTVQVHRIYYPDWKATIDGKEQRVTYNEDGIVTIAVPKGEHTVDAVFTETPLRLMSNIISLGSFFFISFFSLRQWYEKKKK